MQLAQMSLGAFCLRFATDVVGQDTPATWWHKDPKRSQTARGVCRLYIDITSPSYVQRDDEASRVYRECAVPLRLLFGRSQMGGGILSQINRDLGCWWEMAGDACRIIRRYAQTVIEEKNRVYSQ